MTAEPLPSDIQPVSNEALDRIATGLITVLPMVALGLAGWQLWQGLLHPSDLVVFAIMYVATGLGVTVGFHRHLTHRAFKTRRWVRGLLAILGSAAIEGPVISWVADHRKHHAFADRFGDPHSPHVDHGGGWRGALRVDEQPADVRVDQAAQRGAKTRFAPDLLDDPLIRFVNSTFLVWAVAGFLASFGLGWAIGGTFSAGLTGMLWGGLVRMFVLHHVTYSINSVCHFMGRRAFATGDESRNVAWLALPSFGESWHNNHHAFPTSAAHGLRRLQLDPSAAVIRGLERLGLAWDVVRIAPERQALKAAAPAPDRST
jgi:stearoyl-CoA desaturase (Delta-9 desaturase)